MRLGGAATLASITRGTILHYGASKENMTILLIDNASFGQHYVVKGYHTTLDEECNFLTDTRQLRRILFQIFGLLKGRNEELIYVRFPYLAYYNGHRFLDCVRRGNERDGISALRVGICVRVHRRASSIQL
ncbi:hypothetical protein Tco_1164684 [Tanacetum coccineum]